MTAELAVQNQRQCPQTLSSRVRWDLGTRLGVTHVQSECASEQADLSSENKQIHIISSTLAILINSTNQNRIMITHEQWVVIDTLPDTEGRKQGIKSKRHIINDTISGINDTTQLTKNKTNDYPSTVGGYCHTVDWELRGRKQGCVLGSKGSKQHIKDKRSVP